MAVTRLMPLHINKGHSSAESFIARLSYATNPEKTNEGALVTAYACHAETAAGEFELMRREYHARTGRWGRHGGREVLAYQIRQSFKPGEVTPEEANRIGCELADRFFKGRHPYIVATHTDKHHIHNHIIICAFALGCDRKFRNFWGSTEAMSRMSDQLCLEHKLSVVENPQKRDTNYDRWLGSEAKPSNRDLLRTAIDEMLQKHPDGFEALMKLLEEAGWRIKRGKQYSLCPPGGKRYIRLDTLGDEYSEQALREALGGKRRHVPQPTRRMKNSQKVSLIIDIQKKVEEGKGKGYENWAKVFNVKQLAASIAYLSANKIDSFEELTARVDAAIAKNTELKNRMNAAEDRLQEIAEIKKTIHSYLRTKDVYAGWKSSGWSKAYYAQHQQELDQHKAAKQAFDQMGGKIPTIKELSAEYEEVLAQKQADFAAYRENRQAMRELLNVEANVALATGRENVHRVQKKDEQTR